MIDENAVMVPTRGVAFRKVGDQVVLVTLGENVLLTLNATGSAVWQALDGHRSAGEVSEQVAARFDVTAEQARRDVFGFLELMCNRGLLDVRGATE